MVLRRAAIWLIAIGITAMASIGGVRRGLSNAAGTLGCRLRPGGSNDIIARLIGRRLSERLGQQFVIENKPGAGGNFAAKR